MRTINLRRSLHSLLVFLEWWICGKIHGYKFIEVASPVTAKVEKVEKAQKKVRRKN